VRPDDNPSFQRYAGTWNAQWFIGTPEIPGYITQEEMLRRENLAESHGYPGYVTHERHKAKVAMAVKYWICREMTPYGRMWLVRYGSRTGRVVAAGEDLPGIINLVYGKDT
jgi:hypothetical protein